MVAHQPSAESIEQELERILASRAFDGAGRARRFLRFVVQETLRSPNVCLKEYLIGMAVLDRGESFDPRSDSIVRVEAGRLRSRLRQYYKDEGQDNPVRIVLPKGQYAPIFEAPPANDTAASLERLKQFQPSRRQSRGQFVRGLGNGSRGDCSFWLDCSWSHLQVPRSGRHQDHVRSMFERSPFFLWLISRVIRRRIILQME